MLEKITDELAESRETVRRLCQEKKSGSGQGWLPSSPHEQVCDYPPFRCYTSYTRVLSRLRKLLILLSSLMNSNLVKKPLPVSTLLTQH